VGGEKSPPPCLLAALDGESPRIFCIFWKYENVWLHVYIFSVIICFLQ